jgi:cystathionine beta-lyase
VLDPAAKHAVFATLGEDLAARTVTLMAASKTFNIAGLTCGFAIIPDAGLRTRFRRVIQDCRSTRTCSASPPPRPRSTTASRGVSSAWSICAATSTSSSRNSSPCPASCCASVRRPASCVWFDVTALGYEDAHAEFEKGGVGLSNGADFGGPGHVRLNFGCPRERLREILRRMKAVVARAPGSKK